MSTGIWQPFTIIAKDAEARPKLEKYFNEFSLTEPRDSRNLYVTPIQGQPIPLMAIAKNLPLIDAITTNFGGHIMQRARQEAAVQEIAQAKRRSNMSPLTRGRRP